MLHIFQVFIFLTSLRRDVFEPCQIFMIEFFLWRKNEQLSKYTSALGELKNYEK